MRVRKGGFAAIDLLERAGVIDGLNGLVFFLGCLMQKFQLAMVIYVTPYVGFLGLDVREDHLILDRVAGSSCRIRPCTIL